MNNIEETLWNYIDGNCSANERQAIEKLIASDEAYGLKYQELLSFNLQMAALEPDEPSMAFTYNVMEAIRTENAHTPLKAAINKRIILSIAAFFLITISLLVLYVITNVNWSFGNLSFSAAPINFKAPALINVPTIKNYLNGPVIKGFLFFDVVFGLFLLDAWLHKRNFEKIV